MPKVILFDIDGTLLMAGGAGRRAFLSALHELHGPFGEAPEYDFRGRTDLELFATAAQQLISRPLTDIEFKLLLERFVSLFETELQNSAGFRVFPEAAVLVQELSRHDEVFLGIQTGNIERTAALKLRRAGLHHHFEFGGYGSDHVERAHFMQIALERARTLYGADFHAHQVVVVGDTPLDIAAARQNNFNIVAVETGGIDRKSLQESGANLVVPTLAPTTELLEFLMA